MGLLTEIFEYIHFRWSLTLYWKKNNASSVLLFKGQRTQNCHKKNVGLWLSKKQMATFEIPAEEVSGQWLNAGRSHHQYTLCRTICFSPLPLAWENSRQFPTLPLVPLWNDIWLRSAEIPYWWRITTQIWVVSRHQDGISALVLRTPFLRLLFSLPCLSGPGKVKRQTWSTDMKIV